MTIEYVTVRTCSILPSIWLMLSILHNQGSITLERVNFLYSRIPKTFAEEFKIKTYDIEFQMEMKG